MQTNINGWLIFDKPEGISSFSLVRQVKRILRVKKVGHAGTLDPMASGVLPIAIGEATKTIDYVINKPKTYEFTIKFGIETDTLDLEGKILKQKDAFVSLKDLKKAQGHFNNKVYNQVPPKFSAIKINGQRAYKLARNNQDFNIDSHAKEVHIYDLDILHFNEKKQEAILKTRVSKGTYIRSLASDIASFLNEIGTTITLRRTSIGSINDTCLLLSKLLYNNTNESDLLVNLLDINKMLDDIPALLVDSKEYNLIKHGNIPYSLSNISIQGVIKVIYNTKLIALLNNSDCNLSILRVFNL